MRSRPRSTGSGQQVLPLYESLHCYVRAKLSEFYGEDLVPLDAPIPAHLLGNMWAQDWSNIYDLVAPEDADPGYDLTALVENGRLRPAQNGCVRREFFQLSRLRTPAPKSFWERSLFTKPQDREVVCHASAWDVEDGDDLRIKMCIEINAEDFQTIHHELGHNYYQRAYKDQPYLFRGSANDGFHEAIGDAIALSVTPAYLVELGLLDREPPPSKDIGLLLRDALGKVAFLPFGILVDQWRWGVFRERSRATNTTPAGGRCARNIREFARPTSAAKISSIRERSTTSPETRPTAAISSPLSCSSSFTGRCARLRATRGRSTAARSTAARKPVADSTKCSRWG